MKTLVEGGELPRLRAMAEGARPFERSVLWERLSALDWSEIKKLPPRSVLRSSVPMRVTGRPLGAPAAAPEPPVLQWEDREKRF